MIKRYVQFSIERVWDIEGFPDYFFGADNQLYRYDSRGRYNETNGLWFAIRRDIH